MHFAILAKETELERISFPISLNPAPR